MDSYSHARFQSQSQPIDNSDPLETTDIDPDELRKDLKDLKCAPTFTNLWVGDTICACRLLEIVLSGAKSPVDRRPSDTERSAVIKSGNVFVYEERDNGIKRWTDGLHWSPSRISGNFLMYRELPGAFPPGQKKKALKRKSPEAEEDESQPGRSYDGSSLASSSAADGGASTSSPVPQSPESSRRLSRQDSQAPDKRLAERNLYGSLTKSYDFKREGLMKKTMSVKVDGRQYHVVAYYDPGVVLEGGLKDSTHHPELRSVTPRHDLLYGQPWRAPLEVRGPVSLDTGREGHSYPPPPQIWPPTAYQPTMGGFQMPQGFQQSQNPFITQMPPPGALYYSQYGNFSGSMPHQGTEAMLSSNVSPTTAGPGHGFPHYPAAFPYTGYPPHVTSSITQSSLTHSPISPTHHHGGYPQEIQSPSRPGSAFSPILPSQHPGLPEAQNFYQPPRQQRYRPAVESLQTHGFVSQNHSTQPSPMLSPDRGQLAYDRSMQPQQRHASGALPIREYAPHEQEMQPGQHLHYHSEQHEDSRIAWHYQRTGPGQDQKTDTYGEQR